MAFDKIYEPAELSLIHISFEIHYEEGTLPEVFPEARTRVSRTAKATAKAITQESAEIMVAEAIEPEPEAAAEESLSLIHI